MTQDQAIKLLRKHRPKNERDLLAAGFTLSQIGNGAFRNAYSIHGANLVVKIPSGTGFSQEEKWHSHHEVLAVRRINRYDKYESLRPYMPVMHYYNKKSGLIVFERYKKASWRKVKIFAKELNKTAAKLMGVGTCDIDNSGNIGVDKQGNYKLLDLGCVIGGND